MDRQPRPVRAFTTIAPNLVNVLLNKIEVSEACEFPTSAPPLKREYTCIWDTGAQGTVISPKLVRELNLKPSGRATIRGVAEGGKVNEIETNTYRVNIYLPDNVTIVDAPLAEVEIGGADVLIGMDILSNGDFAITNYNGQTCWSFRIPSSGKIDFIKEVSEHNHRYFPRPLTDDERRKEKNRRKRERKFGR